MRRPRILDESSALFEFEMLDCVRYIHQRPIDPGIHQGAIEQFARWADKWTALLVFFIAGLFADENDLSGSRSFTKHGLRRVSVEIASAAGLNGFLELARRRPLRNVRGGTSRSCSRHRSSST